GEAAIAEELETLLIDATRIRLRADVPVGAYLSGGFDSSATTALARLFPGAGLRTFSVAFESPEFDESEHQRRVVAALRTDHTSVRCTRADIAWRFPDVIRHTERPVLRTAPAPLYLLSRHVRSSGFKVVVTGEGADEVLGGYDIFKEAKVRRFWARRPASRWRPLLLSRLYPYLEGVQRQPQAYLQAFFGTGLESVDDPLFSHLPRFRLTARAKAFFSADLRAELRGYDAMAELRESLPPEFGAWHPLSQAQYLETAHLLPGYILSSQGDRVAMANAVEGRFPFLDHRVVDPAAPQAEGPAREAPPEARRRQVLARRDRRAPEAAVPLARERVLHGSRRARIRALAAVARRARALGPVRPGRGGEARVEVRPRLGPDRHRRQHGAGRHPVDAAAREPFRRRRPGPCARRRGNRFCVDKEAPCSRPTSARQSEPSSTTTSCSGKASRRSPTTHLSWMPGSSTRPASSSSCPTSRTRGASRSQTTRWCRRTSIRSAAWSPTCSASATTRARCARVPCPRSPGPEEPSHAGRGLPGREPAAPSGQDRAGRGRRAPLLRRPGRRREPLRERAARARPRARRPRRHLPEQLGRGGGLDLRHAEGRRRVQRGEPGHQGGQARVAPREVPRDGAGDRAQAAARRGRGHPASALARARAGRGRARPARRAGRVGRGARRGRRGAGRRPRHRRRPRDDRHHLGLDRRAQGRDDDAPERGRRRDLDHDVPAELARGPRAVGAAARLRLRPVPGADEREGRRDARAREVVHLSVARAAEAEGRAHHGAAGRADHGRHPAADEGHRSRRFPRPALRHEHRGRAAAGAH